MSRQAVDPETRALALELARTEGVATAAERTGVPAGTIRVWLSRAKAKAGTPATAPATVVEPELAALTEFESQTLRRAKTAVEAALKRLEELLPQAKGVQSVAISAGILMDKVERLNAVIAEAQEREIRLSERDAAWLVAAMKGYMDGLGLPWATNHVCRKVWAEILRGGPAHEPFRMPAEMAAARDELMAKLRADVRREVEAELRQEAERGQRERLALPAPGESDGHRLRAWQEEQRAEPDPEPEPPEPETEADDEPVTGEVLDEDDPGAPPTRPGPGWIWKQGRWQKPGGRLPPRLDGPTVKGRW